MNWLEEILFEIRLLFLKTPKQKHIDKIFKNCNKITISELQNNPKNNSLREVKICTITSINEINYISSLFKIYEGDYGAQMTISTVNFKFEYFWGITKHIGLLCGGDSLRISKWKGDAPLKNSNLLVEWLSKNNVQGPIELQELLIEQQKQDEIEYQEWLTITPKNIEKLGMSVSKDWKKSFLSEMTKEFPLQKDLILNLFYIYGKTLFYHDSGIPHYKLIPKEILLQYEIENLISAINPKHLSHFQKKGVVRLFTSYDFTNNRKEDLNKIHTTIKEELTLPDGL